MGWGGGCKAVTTSWHKLVLKDQASGNSVLAALKMLIKFPQAAQHWCRQIKMRHQCYGYNNHFFFFFCWAVVAHTYNLSTWQAEAGVYFHPVHLTSPPPTVLRSLPTLLLTMFSFSQTEQKTWKKIIFKKQESKHQKRPKKKFQQRKMKQKKFICISQLLLLGMEPIRSVDIPTHTPLSVAIVSHLRVVETGKIWRNWRGKNMI